MKIYKFISLSFIITLASIFYVHQNIEIIKSGYTLQANKRYISQLVEQNSKLMYNLSKLESPRNLLIFLGSDKVEFASNRGGYMTSSVVNRADFES